MNFQKKSGFTLVEMAVVLVIGATLLTAGLKVLSAQLENSNYTNTKNKQEAIKDALITYLGANSRLPCPDTDFTAPDGIENRATAGVPTTACSSSYGIIPYQTLQVSKEAILDGWGNYFSYQISTAPANADWSLTSNFHVGNTGSIKVSTRVSSTSAAVLEDNRAVVVLISHGKNGAGAYTVKGTKYADPPAASDELANAALVSAANTFYRRGYSDDSSGGGVFDDLILTIIPNEFITPLTKQGALKAPNVLLAEQFNTIQNAIIASIVTNPCATPIEGPSHSLPNGLGLTPSDMTDPWGVAIEYHQGELNINESSIAANNAFTLTSTGSVPNISFSKTVGIIQGIVAQSVNSYTTTCP